MPTASMYRPTIGKARASIEPASGVGEATAANRKHRKTATRQAFASATALTSPAMLRATSSSGVTNASPNASMIRRTKVR